MNRALAQQEQNFVKVVVKGSRVLEKAHDETKMIRLGCILGVPHGDKFS